MNRTAQACRVQTEGGAEDLQEKLQSLQSQLEEERCRREQAEAEAADLRSLQEETKKEAEMLVERLAEERMQAHRHKDY